MIPLFQKSHLDIVKSKRSPHTGNEHGIGKPAEPQACHLDEDAHSNNHPAIMNFSHRLKPYTHPIDDVNSF
jgi:hypothetical protein